MGTETQKLQQEIKRLIKQLGWSQKRFARELHGMSDEADCSTMKEVGQYVERMKKQLTRSTVAPELLEAYLQQLQSHQDFAKLDVFIPYFVPDDRLPKEFVAGMKTISGILDE